MNLPELSILIVSYNTRALLADCLRSLRRVSDEAKFETIVVDNASSDGSADFVAEDFPEVKLVRLPQNNGFAAGMNAGIAASSGPLILALNPDAVVVPGTLRKLLTFMKENPRAAVVGAVLTFPDGRLQASTFHFPSLFREFWNFLPELKGLLKRGRSWSNQLAEREPFQTDCVSGAALLARTEAVKAIGGFDEEFFLYHEEMDLCTSLKKAGWEIWSVPEAQVVHLDAQSSGYRQNRLPHDPILSWRLSGMDRLWAKHKSSFQHRLWRCQAKSLLWVRIVLLSRGALFSSKYRQRIGELRRVAKMLKAARVLAFPPQSGGRELEQAINRTKGV